MNARWMGLTAVMMLGLGASAACAQGWANPDPYDPWLSVARADGGPVVSLKEAPEAPLYIPRVQYAYAAPVAPRYYAAPATAYRPVVAAPCVNCSTYRAAASVTEPYAAYNPAVVPTTAYRPLLVDNAATTAVAAGPKVIVKPKIVYVEGQPIRNFFRAITP